MSLNIIFDFVNILLCSLSLVMCIAILLLIVVRIHSVMSKVTVLLVCNTYVAIFFVNVMILTVNIYNLYGDSYPSSVFDDFWCPLRTYLVFVGFCAFYYSFVLQASFRLVRVVFYKRKVLQSRSVFLVGVGLQWLLAFVLPSINLLLYDYTYITEEYKCWLSFDNLRGSLLGLLFPYSLPLLFITVIYIRILRYIRQNNHLQQRQEANKRDVLVLQRIAVLLIFTVAIGLPTAIIWLIYIISRYLIPHAYDIQALCLSIAFFASAICFTLITPELKEIWSRNPQQIHPINTARQKEFSPYPLFHQHLYLSTNDDSWTQG